MPEFFAAKRIVGEIVDRLIVDVRHAGFEPFGEARTSLGIAQGVLLAFRAEERRDGPEELVPGDPALVADVAKIRGGRTSPLGSPPGTCGNPGAPSVFDVLAQLLQLTLVAM